MPLLAFAIAVTLAPTPAIAVGVMILAACPGGLTSNAYSFATRADVSMLLGLVLGWAFKLPVPQRVAITFDIGVQNIAVATLIVLNVLDRPEFYPVILVYQLLMKVGAVAFMFVARRWLRSDSASREQPAAALAGTHASTTID